MRVSLRIVGTAEGRGCWARQDVRERTSRMLVGKQDWGLMVARRITRRNAKEKKKQGRNRVRLLRGSLMGRIGAGGEPLGAGGGVGDGEGDADEVVVVGAAEEIAFWLEIGADLDFELCGDGADGFAESGVGEALH